MNGATLRILLAGEPGAGAGAIAEALSSFTVVRAAGFDEARAALDAPFDLVLATLSARGLDLLEEARTRHPAARRVLFARHDDLPEVFARPPGLVEKVLPLGAQPQKIRAALAQLLFPDEVSVSVSRTRGLDFMAAEELFRWTAVRLTQAKGVVVRPLDSTHAPLALQMVLTQSRKNEALREDLLKRWLWPLKPRGSRAATADRSHPVLQRLGVASLDAEVYAQKIGKEPLWIFVALFPWSQEPRLTAALGVVAPGMTEPGFVAPPHLQLLVADAHRRALDEVTDFPLPALKSEDETTGAGQSALEYDWIVTPEYVGPDRRKAPTTFLNRYVLTGRRRRVPSRLRNIAPSFADRFSGAVWWLFGLYLALALMDTALTWIHVRSGAVREANPLLRPLVLHHPALFVLVKNALALGAFTVVARFQLFKWGLNVLRLTVALYLALDLYWVVLLALR